jgi:hypothetical protein
MQLFVKRRWSWQVFASRRVGVLAVNRRVDCGCGKFDLVSRSKDQRHIDRSNLDEIDIARIFFRGVRAAQVFYQGQIQSKQIACVEFRLDIRYVSFARVKSGKEKKKIYSDRRTRPGTETVCPGAIARPPIGRDARALAILSGRPTGLSQACASPLPRPVLAIIARASTFARSVSLHWKSFTEAIRENRSGKDTDKENSESYVVVLVRGSQLVKKKERLTQIRTWIGTSLHRFV